MSPAQLDLGRAVLDELEAQLTAPPRSPRERESRTPASRPGLGATFFGGDLSTRCTDLCRSPRQRAVGMAESEVVSRALLRRAGYEDRMPDGP